MLTALHSQPEAMKWGYLYRATFEILLVIWVSFKPCAIEIGAEI